MSKEKLGNAGWTILHMIASTYPLTVDATYIEKTNLFLNLFGQFYPCPECSKHFLSMIRDK